MFHHTTPHVPEHVLEDQIAEDRHAERECTAAALEAERMAELHRCQMELPPTAEELQNALARFVQSESARLPAGWSLAVTLDASTLKGPRLCLAVSLPPKGAGVSCHAPTLSRAIEGVIEKAWDATAAIASVA